MRMFIVLIVLSFCGMRSHAQEIIQGSVINRIDQTPLSGVTIRVNENNIIRTSDLKGEFTLNLPAGNYNLVVTALGFEEDTVSILVPFQFPELLFELKPIEIGIEAVELVYSGYFQVPRERATGSFVPIGNDLLNRKGTLDILSRLEGVAPSMTFDTRRAGEPRLRIRGLSTFHADREPLIILDNFPYEGSIENINPNDIETVTILRDASATSIWGARAGNGVIVITSKKGQFDQKSRITITSNTSISEKPNIFYDKDWIGSEEYIKFETELFNNGFYNATISNRNMAVLTPVVELLTSYRAGDITEIELQSYLQDWNGRDVRNDITEYFYLNPIAQQFAVSLSGGSNQVNYIFNSNVDKSYGDIIGKKNSKVNLLLGVNFKPFSRLELSSRFSMMNFDKRQGALTSIADLEPLGRRLYPYAALVDENGESVTIPKNHRLSYAEISEELGLLDWTYKPLDEYNKIDRTNTLFESRLDLGARYKLLDGFDIDLKYQFQRLNSKDNSLFFADSYYVRDLVNRFTQVDGSLAFPHGDVLRYNHFKNDVHNGRGQLNYEWTTENLQLFALAGIEARHSGSSEEGNELVGYDHDVLTYAQRIDYLTRFHTLPSGSAQIASPNFRMNSLTDRYLSYYVNSSYRFYNRYTFSGSMRWDGSNLFGVKTNQKGVPLWSFGGLWDVSEETFFNSSVFQTMQFRMTVGTSGNMDRTTSAYPVVIYSNNSLTGLQRASILRPGNEELRWETINTLNTAIRFGAWQGRMTGNVEAYFKWSSDLLGNEIADQTTGYLTSQTPYRVNYGKMKTNGIDVELSAHLLPGDLKWRVNTIFSYAFSRVTNYKEDYASVPIGTFTTLAGSEARAITGKSPDAIYSYPWYGLDPHDGSVLIPEEFPTFNHYISSLNYRDLIHSGVSIPPYWGYVRNDFSWKNIELGFNISYKLGHHFRRSSINYSRAFSNGEVHQDYLIRWQHPGDETRTNVPALPTSVNQNRDGLYHASEIMVVKGDHIKLEDIYVSYFLSRAKQIVPFDLKIYCNVGNFGVLWKANRIGLDPVYRDASIIPGRRVTLGINIEI